MSMKMKTASWTLTSMALTMVEVDYQMTYRNIIGKSFDWLYADSVVLAESCRQCGLKCEILAQGQHYDYLARIVQM